MEQQLSEEQLKSLVAKFRCPQGEMGIATGLNMNTNNQTMIAEILKL